MSKELIERLTTVCEAMEAGVEDWPIASHIWEYRQAIARIEELERERDAFYMDYRMKCDEETKALQADNARLQALLTCIRDNLNTGMGRNIQKLQAKTIDEELVITPEQSLARLRNHVREECAILLESMCESDWSPKQLADTIRARSTK